MVNYLERTKAFAECTNNELQPTRPKRLPKVNFDGRQRRYSSCEYYPVDDLLQNYDNNHYMTSKPGLINASARSFQYRCCCGVMHIVTGTGIFLLIYVALSIITFTIGMKSALLWSVIPFVITMLTVYALCTEKHRYLYPFLIISGVHIVLCIMMVLIIIALTAVNYATFRQIVGYSVKVRLNDAFTVVLVITSVILFLTLSVIHLWQVTVVYSCMLYFEKKHFFEREQYQPMIAKNYGRRLEDGQYLNHGHLATHNCYKSCASL